MGAGALLSNTHIYNSTNRELSVKLVDLNKNTREQQVSPKTRSSILTNKGGIFYVALS